MQYKRLVYLSIFLVFFALYLPRKHAICSYEERENNPPSSYENHQSFGREIKPFRLTKRSLRERESLASKKRRVGDSRTRLSTATLQPLESPLEDIHKIKTGIQDAYGAGNAASLHDVYKSFESLMYEEKVWQDLGQQLAAKKWPSQSTEKEVVGGHLFFPLKQLYDYTESTYTEPLLKRRDILSGFLLAGSFHHPLGLFYLGHILLKSNWNDQDWGVDTDEDDGPAVHFSRQLLATAYEDLRMCLKEPDVAYAIGYGYINDPFNHKRYISLQDIDLSLEDKDPKTHFITIHLRRYSRLFTPPIWQDFLALAENGFKAAYQSAAELAEEQANRQQALSILEKGASQGCVYAFIRLAEIEADTPPLKNESWIYQAMAHGISQAFILKGSSLIGDLKWKADKEKLFLASAHDQEEAAKYFHQAGTLNDPQGFEYRGRLKLRLSKNAGCLELQDNLKRQAYDAFMQGCKLGCEACYWQALKLAEKEEERRLLKALDPYTLWKQCQAFLEDKNKRLFSPSI